MGLLNAVTGVPSYIAAQNANPNPLERMYTANRGATGLTTGASAASYPLLTIRNQLTELDKFLFLNKVSVVSGASTNFLFQLWLAPTVAGTDAVDYTGNQLGSFEYDVTRDNTNTLTAGVDGRLVYSQLWTGGEPLVVDFNNALVHPAFDGVQNEIVFAVYNISGAAEEFNIAVTWWE